MRVPNSEIIRAQALKILAGRITGVRLADLRFLTEQVLHNIIPKDTSRRGSYRSAIWDLDKRFPDYVIKKVIGQKHAIFIPTPKLIKEEAVIKVPIQPEVNDVEESNGETSILNEFIKFKHDLLDLFRFIDYMRLEKFVPNETLIQQIGFEEYKILTKISMHIESLRELKATSFFDGIETE